MTIISLRDMRPIISLRDMMASFGGSDGDSDYVELAENQPMIPANTLDLMGHISELEAMHKVLEGDIVAIT